MRGATINSIECMIKLCERDVEQVQRRLTEIKGKLVALKKVGTYSASRDAQAMRTGAREVGARASSSHINSINIKEIDRTDATNVGIADGTSSKSSINHFFNLDYILNVTCKEMPSVPEWYVRWWHATQTANGWTTNQGKAITDYSWRPLLMTWWRNADEKERALIENEAKAAKSAAEANRVYTAADWKPCGEAGCFYFNDEKCLCSLQIAIPPKVPRKCAKFYKTE